MSTNTWVDASSSYVGGGWVADMGVYVGDWPLMAPAVIDDTDGEVDFYVAQPHPSGEPGLFGDGSYATDLYAASRYTGWPDQLRESYYSHRLPGYGNASGVAPPGAHIFVVVYTSAPPPHPPSFYVPRLYSASGQASAYTAAGGYSDVQPGPVVDHVALPMVKGEAALALFVGASGQRNTTNYGSTLYQTYPPPYPTWPQVQDYVIDLQRQHTGSDGLNPSTFLYLQAEKSDAATGPINPPAYDTTMTAGAGAGEWVFGWTARLGVDPVGTDLTYGVDYGDNPNPADQYQSFVREPGAVDIEWEDMPNPVADYVVESSYLGEGQQVTLTSTVDFTAVPGTWMGLFDPSVPADPNFTGPQVIVTDSVSGVSTGGPARTLPLGPAVLPVSTAVPRGTRSWGLSVTPRDTFQTLIRQAQVETAGATPQVWGDVPGTRAGGSVTITVGGGAPLPGEMAPPAWELPRWADVTTYQSYAGAVIQGAPYKAHNQPWRYWKPNRIVPVKVGSYLRMTQRNDGNGISRHPRLSASMSTANSTQAGHAPRLGTVNRYS